VVCCDGTHPVGLRTNNYVIKDVIKDIFKDVIKDVIKDVDIITC